MAVIVNGDGILTGVSSLTTALDDLTSGRGTITGVTTVGTLQLGTGVSISSPRSQNAAIFTNNTEFLTVDDAGRVGVGTISPNTDAHPQNVGKINVGFITARSVAGDIDANTLVVAGLSTFTDAVTITNATPTINLVDSDVSTTATLLGSSGNIYYSSSSSNRDHIFRGSTTEVARITGDGKFGLNKSSPDTPLHVYHATTNGVATFESGDTICLANFKDNSTSASPAIGATADDLILLTSDVTRVRVKSTGNVGVGINSPGLPLHVYHATSNGILKVESGDANAGITIADNGGEVSVRAISNDLTFNTSSSEIERMRLTSGGRLLLGTTSDSAGVGVSPFLQVEDITGAPYGRASFAYNGADAVGPGIYFTKSRGTANGATTIVQDSDQLGAIFFTGADGNDRASRGGSIQCHVDGTPGSNDMPGRLTFHTTEDGASTSAERLRITSAGKVLIGTTNTAGIPGSSGAVGLRVKSNAVGSNFSDGAISLIGTGGDFYAITMRDSSNNGWGLLPIFSASTDRLDIGYYDAPNTTNKTIVSIRENGDLNVVDGNLVIGTSGHGIDFSATSNNGTSELLDDYEEGSWIATVTYSNGGQATLSESLGFYTKIGNQVHIQAAITFSAQGGGSGNVRINGLPYTASGDNGKRINGFMTYATGFSSLNSIPVLYVAGAYTYMEPFHLGQSNGTATGITNVTRNNCNSNTTIRLYATYTV